ncbi:hypothetical protein [Calidithermus timidus]|uniref:hypothetical protein n=1 Tax=Calidithermus timidus TaxID=307124 RepID=UPI001FE13B3E|nr:hypothetical protein [Calidithermus timidus]
MWLERFTQAGIPVTPVNNLAQARGMIQQVEPPTLGSIPLIGSPLAQTPAHPPLLGERTGAVLSEVLGYTPEQIRESVATGVGFEQSQGASDTGGLSTARERLTERYRTPHWCWLAPPSPKWAAPAR